MEKVGALNSDQEEADTRHLLHTQHAPLNHPCIMVMSPDTDVAILCINMYSEMGCTQLWLRTGVKQRLRYTPVHQIVSVIGRQVC